MKKSLLFLLFLSSLRLIVGCGSANSTPPPPVPAAATHFSVSSAAAETAGTPFNITVTALDASNSVVASYSATVRFTSTDPQAVLPANSPLTNGTGTFSITLKTASAQTISVSATGSAVISGTSSSINVTGAPATHFSVITPANGAAGTSFSFTVNALDASNNVATGYSGTVHFTSTDSQAVLPANSTLTNGIATFSATLKTLGPQTIVVTDVATASLTGTSSSMNIVGMLTIASSAPPSGTVGATYGPLSSEYFRCVWSPVGGFHLSCVPCDPATCASLPPCPRGGIPTTPCLSIQQANLGFPLLAAGGLSPYRWSWAPAPNSSLPPGLSLVNGKIAGGSRGPTGAGSFNVIVTVTDSSSPAVNISANYTIVIAPPPPLAITSGAPPDGTLGSPYGLHANGFFFTASGGLTPVTWSWVAAAGSALPPGLNLSSNGVVSGTPTTTTAGTYQVIATVADSETPPMQLSAKYTIVIAIPPPPTISTSPAPAIGALNVPYVGYTFAAINGLAPFTWTETGALPPGILPLSSAGALSGTPTATGSFPITVQVQDALGRNSSPQNFNLQVLAKGFTPTGSMSASRELHTATLLNDGTVLVTGGVGDASTFFTQAMLYDPPKGTFAPTTGSMTTFRVSPEAVLLQSGRVLLVGGKGPNSQLATAETYDPATQTFASTKGSMAAERVYHTATLLNDGTVLVTGGLDPTGSFPVATAELFDPVKETFTSVGNMQAARFFQTATLLPNGKVLIAGGMDNATGLSTAELYDPSTKAFVPAGNLVVARAGHTATSLSSGKVLITGGTAIFAEASISTAEIFDPSTGNFTATGNMAAARSLHTATLRNDGTVLLTGGDVLFYSGQGQSLSSAELFDPITGSFSAVSNMTAPRESHTATLLNTGEVLVVGGSNGTLGYSNTTVSATAELFQ
jgi:hypothetical protein